MKIQRHFGNSNQEKEFKKLVGIIIIVSLIFVLVCGIIQHVLAVTSEKRYIKAVDAELTNGSIKIERILETLKIIAEQSNYNLYMKNFLGDITNKNQLEGNNTYENIRKLLWAVSRDNEEISYSWLADFDGDFFMSDDGYISDNNWKYKERPWFKKTMESKNSYITEPYSSADDNEIIVSIINPIFDEKNNLLGAFAVDINFDYIVSQLAAIDTYKGDNLIVMTGGNSVVIRSNGKNVLKNFSEIQDNDEIKEAISYLKHDELPSGSPSGWYTATNKLASTDWKMILSTSRDTLKANEGKEYAYINFLIVVIAISLYSMLLLIFINKYFHAVKNYKIRNFDELTGIYNYKGLSDDVNDKFEARGTKDYYYCIFKIRKINILNDMLGFDKVSELIKYVALCLKEEAEEEESYGRISGNEFGLLFLASNEATARDRLKSFSEKITKFKVSKESNNFIQLEIGVYKISDEINFEKIQSFAEFTLEMSHNISNYETSVAFYDDKYKERYANEKQLENDMENAIANNEFVIYIQGKYNLYTKNLNSAEVLVRWNHSKRGLISPIEFIPLFEKNGFILKMDIVVFEKTCQKLRKWLDEGLEPVPLAVNLSRLHVNNVNIADDLYEIMQKYEIPSNLLQVELTESALSGNINNLMEIIKKFKAKNISIAIDDFGTGYSTLSTLKELMFDTLKIDREFFVDMHNNQRGKAIIRNILIMARELNLQTVSEGIETEEQMHFLKEVNGDLVQGFYFSRPLPVEDFEKILSLKGGVKDE